MDKTLSQSLKSVSKLHIATNETLFKCGKARGEGKVTTFTHTHDADYRLYGGILCDVWQLTSEPVLMDFSGVLHGTKDLFFRLIFVSVTVRFLEIETLNTCRIEQNMYFYFNVHTECTIEWYQHKTHPTKLYKPSKSKRFVCVCGKNGVASFYTLPLLIRPHIFTLLL